MIFPRLTLGRHALKRALPLAVLLAAARSSSAATIHVLPDGSGDAPTIAAALVIAQSGDVISLGPGTFYEHDLVWKNQVRLVSDTGDPATTFIDAQGLGRCVEFTNVTGPAVRGITFMNGVSAGVGGSVKAENCGYGFDTCVFRNGSAGQGGGVGTPLVVSGVRGPYFQNCRFEDNVATSGGALSQNWPGGIGNCVFERNQASLGGALYVQKRPFDDGPFVDGCIFTDNEATQAGGAVYTAGNQDQFFVVNGVYIIGSEFRGNRAPRGGALHLGQFDSATESRFFENVAANDGGAIYLAAVRPNVDFEGGWVDYNVFARNKAALGGAVVMAGGEPQFGRNTLVANQAPSGSHIAFVGSVASSYVMNCILAFGVDGAAAAGPGRTVRCFDVYGNAGGDWVGPLAGQLGTNGNISADPQFCEAASDNYYVAVGSPCLQCPIPPSTIIGRHPAGCQPPTAVEARSWGAVKGLFRR